MKKRYRATGISPLKRELVARALFQTKVIMNALDRIMEYADVSDIWNEDIQEDVPESGGYGADLPPQSNQYYTKASLVRKRMELVETLREIEKNIKFY